MYIHTYICTIIESSGHVVVHLLAMHSMEHVVCLLYVCACSHASLHNLCMVSHAVHTYVCMC